MPGQQSDCYTAAVVVEFWLLLVQFLVHGKEWRAHGQLQDQAEADHQVCDLASLRTGAVYGDRAQAYRPRYVGAR
jgi:hypothetical protein